MSYTALLPNDSVTAFASPDCSISSAHSTGSSPLGESHCAGWRGPNLGQTALVLSLRPDGSYFQELNDQVQSVMYCPGVCQPSDNHEAPSANLVLEPPRCALSLFGTDDGICDIQDARPRKLAEY